MCRVREQEVTVTLTVTLTVTSYAMQEVVEKRIAVNEKGRLDLKETWKSGKIRKTAEMRGKAL